MACLVSLLCLLVATICTKATTGVFTNSAEGLLLGPVFIYEPPQSVDFSNSTGASVECAVHGQPVPTVQWVHADAVTPISNVSNLRLVLANATLHFPPFKADHYHPEVHSAVYRCRAYSPLGAIISRAVHIRAVVVQDYDIQVYDEYVIIGNTAVLKCQIPSFVADYVKVISWVRDAVVTIEPNIQTDSKFIVLPSGELYILNVTAVDAQYTYQCQTIHLLTGEKRISASRGKLAVTETKGSVPPRITDGRSFVQARERDPLILSCASQGHPPPVYSWQRIADDGLITNISNDLRIRHLESLLIFEQTQSSDAGTYVCISTNGLGTDRREIILTINVPLSVHIEPQQQRLDQGKTATFHCVTSGYPILSVIWRKDGRLLENFYMRQNYKLTIRNVTRSNAGMYQCFVSNSLETVQSTAELRLGDSPPEIIFGFDAQTLYPSASVSLQCIFSGMPLPNITWSLDDSSVNINDRVRLGQRVDEKGNIVSYLNISAIQVEEGGLYACSAQNSAGRVVHQAKITVYGIPYIRFMPEIIAIAGDDVFIRCPVSGYPITAIYWEQDGSRLPVNHRQKVFHNGTMIIQNIQRIPDAGKYTCIAKNNDGQSTRRDVQIIIKVPPKIIPFSFQNDQTYEGIRASVFCSLSEGDLPITIHWYKDEKRIHSTSEITTQTINKYASTLIIQKVMERHSGNYTCSASNAAAIVNHTAQLIVKIPPRWKIEPEDGEVLLGESVQIGCHAIGFPPPTISWFKSLELRSGEFVEVASNSRILLSNQGTLRITDAEEEDEGTYMCKAINNVGTGLSKVIYLNVKVPVKIRLEKRNDTIRVGETAKLRCHVNGDPPIQVMWLHQKDNLPVNSNKRYSVEDFSSDSGLVSVLTIISAQRIDSLPFRCVAKNPFGQDDVIVKLLVQDVPQPPEDLKLIQSGSRHIEISWQPANDGIISVNFYIIQYTSKADDWNTDKFNMSVSAAETRALIPNLSPATQYRFRIFAKNDVGLSKPSEFIVGITGEEAPAGSPRDVRVETLSSMKLRVSWKPPKKDLWNGEIRGYHVGYKTYNTTEPNNFRTLSDIEDGKLVVVLDKLNKFTKYSIIVHAFNDRGIGPNSDEVIAMTLEDVPDYPPSNVKCSSVTSQSIHTFWDPIPTNDINGILQGYKVLYRPVKEWYGQHVAYETKITTSLKTILHGLDKFTNYSIHVLGFTSVGDGVKSHGTFCSTLEDVPGPPGDIKALTTSLDSVLVTWREPIHPNGLIKKYTVYIRSTDNQREDTNKINVPENVHRYEAKNLGKHRRHDFWLTASTSIGEGESTRVVSQVTSGPIVPPRIASFSTRFIIPWKETVHFPCSYVGTPSPSVKWLFDGIPIQLSSRVSLHHDGTLTMKELDSSDNGNYTCIVESSMESDNITHVLTVEVPPEPPVLQVVSSSTTSLHLRLIPNNNMITSEFDETTYVLSHRPEYGQWSELILEPGTHDHTLRGLVCGVKYQMYITAHNKIGKGAPSQLVTAKTKGEAPQSPSKEKLILSNSTSIVLHLESWFDGGCPILYFVVEYKLKDSTDWILVSNNVKPDIQRFVITDLLPSESYQLRVTAHNSAGSETAQFDFSTISQYNGAENRSQKEVSTESDDDLGSFFDPSIIVPIVSSVLLVAAVILLVCVFLIKRRVRRNAENEKCSDKYHAVSASIAEEIQKKYYYSEPTLSLENGTLKETKILPKGDNTYNAFQIINSGGEYHPILTNMYSYKQKARTKSSKPEYPLPERIYCDRTNREEVFPHHSTSMNEAEIPDLLERDSESFSPEECSMQLLHRPRRLDRYEHQKEDVHELSCSTATEKISPYKHSETTFIFPRRPNEMLMYCDDMEVLRTDKYRGSAYED